MEEQAPKYNNPNLDENGKFLPGNNANPTGTGGFGDRPDDINIGGRPKNQESFTYWMNFFKNMKTQAFLDWDKSNPLTERTVAADIAYARVLGSRKDLAEFKEVADRTEGKSPQTIRHEGGLFSASKLELVTVDTEEEQNIRLKKEQAEKDTATINSDGTTENTIKHEAEADTSSS